MHHPAPRPEKRRVGSLRHLSVVDLGVWVRVVGDRASRKGIRVKNDKSD